jgi:uncharacterized protein (TIRG00374 family)
MTRRHVWLIVQTLVSVGLLLLLFRRVDWAAFAAVVRRISAPFYFGSLLVIGFGQLLYALRWQIILSGMGVRVSFSDVVRQHLVGVFFSNLMPTGVGGDAAKVFYLGRRAGYTEVGASVFIDRFVGFLWLSILGAALAWTVAARSPLFILNRNLLTIFAAGFVCLLAAGRVVPVDRLMTGLPQAGRWAPWVRRFADLVRLVRDGCRRPATLIAAAVIMAGYVALLTGVYLRYFALSDVPVTAWLPVAGIIVSMAIFVNVPISVNGIGLREQLHYLLFASLGVPKEVAISISLLVFSHMLLLSAAGCVVWLRIRPHSPACERP